MKAETTENNRVVSITWVTTIGNESRVTTSFPLMGFMKEKGLPLRLLDSSYFWWLLLVIDQFEH